MTRRNRPRATADEEGRFSYDGLDRAIHEKARLGILASLAVHEDGLVFNDLKRLCALTDGNLNRHLAVLKEAGLVETRKTDRGVRTRSLYRLTARGRRRFAEYIDVLERVVADAHVEAGADEGPPSGSEIDPETGWSPA